MDKMIMNLSEKIESIISLRLALGSFFGTYNDRGKIELESEPLGFLDITTP